jgi:dihydroorotate dehydrogenase
VDNRQANAVMRVFYGLDPERAHRITIALLSRLPAAQPPRANSRLAVSLAGLDFAHPVLLAAGFDKDAEAAHAIGHLGFAGGEVGTLTPLPQAGNQRPRLFRLVEDGAVINRMGFNNGGVAAAHARLARVRAKGRHGVIGVNIGANKESADRVRDYVNAFAAMVDVADYVTVNISSPNTPGLRGLQDANALDDLLDGVLGLRTAPGHDVPVFLKVAPDLARDDIDALTRVCIDRGVDAIIIGNTTISRPLLAARDAGEAGGLSGAPLAPLALAKLREFRSATGGAMPLIAAGGIASADDVWARLRAGASLVQLYSALVYAGPWLPRRIVRDLLARMSREGVASVGDIIDADNR